MIIIIAFSIVISELMELWSGHYIVWKVGYTGQLGICSGYVWSPKVTSAILRWGSTIQWIQNAFGESPALSLPTLFPEKRMNRRWMVAVPWAWDTLELMSPEYITWDFGGAFFLIPLLTSFVPSSISPRFFEHFGY